MKKTLIALAALASTAAFAQSSVTLSGQMAVAVDSTSWAATTVGRSDGNLNATVTEDLGGGMSVVGSAGVDLRDRGGAVTGRNWNLAVKGGFGTLSYGTSLANLSLRTGAVSNLAVNKGLQFVTDGEAVVYVLSYTSPELAPGLTVGVNDVETAGVTADTMSKKYTFAVNYAQGPVGVAADYRNDDSRFRATASYDLGVAKVAVGMINAYAGKKSQQEAEIAVPMGAITLGAQYAKRGDDKGYAVGASYALSKRTAVQFAYANIDKVGGTAAVTGASSTDFNGGQTRIRLNHTF